MSDDAVGKVRHREGDDPPTASPHQVHLPVNLHHWDGITFLHWPLPPDVVAPLVPDETQVLTYDGAAWIGVTPFFIRVRPFAIPAVLPRCAFPETNVRTYVATADGREGVWFLRMQVTALWFVVTLRAVGLPYVRRRMTVHRDGARFTYVSRPPSRRREGGHHIVVRPGEALSPPAGGPHERFLTARWGAYHRVGPVLLYTPVEHPPWPLRTATVERCDVDDLFRSAGLPAPGGPPLAHFSPGVPVRVGPPRVVAV